MSTTVTFPIARLPALKIAHLPGRLEAQTYPIHKSFRFRWSDLGSQGVSRVAIAHFFEDMRAFSMRSLKSEHGIKSALGDVVLRAITIEYLGHASMDFPCLDMAAGIASVGNSSYTYVMAAFQNGQCIAVGSSTDVRVVNGQSTPWDDEMRAMLYLNLMPLVKADDRRATFNHPPAYLWSLELHTRFSDTDSVGHLNNVSMSRYHDNATMAFVRDALGLRQADANGHNLCVIRQDLSLGAETHFPDPITLCAAVLEVQAMWFTLALASYQDGKRTTTSTATLAWVDQYGQAQLLPSTLLARLDVFQARLAPDTVKPDPAGTASTALYSGAHQ